MTARSASAPPLQNRVLPTGEIVANPARGMLMGNRGCLHNDDRTLRTSRWRSKLWISCVLEWRGRKRDVMTPGSWTALFFLDEATALAAGHRPCGYCRRPDYLWFAESWRAAQGLLSRPLAVEMDARLHAERVDRARRQLTRQVTVADLPDGAMVRHQGVVALVQGAALLPWSITGYGESQQVRAGAQAELLTPPVIVGALAAGYRPLVHHSAAPASRPSVVAGEPAAKLRYFAPPDWRTGADPYG